MDAKTEALKAWKENAGRHNYMIGIEDYKKSLREAIENEVRISQGAVQGSRSYEFALRRVLELLDKVTPLNS